MWAAVCQLYADITDDNSLTLLAKKFGQRSAQLRPFRYLSSQLSAEPFTGKTVRYKPSFISVCSELGAATFWQNRKWCVELRDHFQTCIVYDV